MLLLMPLPLPLTSSTGCCYSSSILPPPLSLLPICRHCRRWCPLLPSQVCSAAAAVVVVLLLPSLIRLGFCLVLFTLSSLCHYHWCHMLKPKKNWSATATAVVAVAAVLMPPLLLSPCRHLCHLATDTAANTSSCHRHKLCLAAAITAVFMPPRRILCLTVSTAVESWSFFFHFHLAVVSVILLPPLPPQLDASTKTSLLCHCRYHLSDAVAAQFRVFYFLC